MVVFKKIIQIKKKQRSCHRYDIFKVLIGLTSFDKINTLLLY